jgi:two-component system cell cycle sensor histidine kinase/response regulator CckA
MSLSQDLYILVVEDEPFVRRAIVTYLIRERFSVLEAANPGEAFALSDTFQGAIALLIADHSLKPLNGRQVAERILRARPNLKVLHISGYPFRWLEKEGGLVSGGFFLEKPFTPIMLLDKINHIFARD